MKFKYYQIKYRLFFAVTVCLLTGFSSCKKFIEVDAPYTSINGENVFSTDATAIGAVTALYARMGGADGSASGTIPTITFYSGLLSDELTVIQGTNEGRLFYTNDLTADAAPNSWQQLYSYIYLANTAIEGLTASNSLTPAVKQQLLGEAKFMRAFCYFYLVNLYGDVPLASTTNYKINSLITRASAVDVWKQIINDLTGAKDLLNSNYVSADAVTSSSTIERVRPNKWVATALLARAYLYNVESAKAEAQATEVINNNTLYSLSSLNNAFLNNPSINKEAIWQIQSVASGWNTNDARVFILPNTGPNSSTNPFYLNKRLVYSFEPNDNRRLNWINGIKVGTDSFYYAYKYKSATLNAPVTEYNIVFRLAEQYLIRAEARAQQNNISGASSDLNVIRKRAGLSDTTISTKEGVLSAILGERRHELFCEWGHRWFDLKRTNTIDAVMSIETPLKGGTWQPTDKFLPITTNELLVNPNLTQTTGY